MAITLTIRNIPLVLHRRLKKRAAAAGLSLPRYVLRLLQRFESEMSIDDARIERVPTSAAFRKRLQSRAAVSSSDSAAETIREHRGSLP